MCTLTTSTPDLNTIRRCADVPQQASPEKPEIKLPIRYGFKNGVFGAEEVPEKLWEKMQKELQRVYFLLPSKPAASKEATSRLAIFAFRMQSVGTDKGTSRVMVLNAHQFSRLQLSHAQ
jgi:hypothetical protein